MKGGNDRRSRTKGHDDDGSTNSRIKSLSPSSHDAIAQANNHSVDGASAPGINRVDHRRREEKSDEMTLQPLSQPSSCAIANKGKQLNHIVIHDEEEQEEQEQTTKAKIDLNLIRINGDEEQDDSNSRPPPRAPGEFTLSPQMRPGAVAVRGPDYTSSDQSTTGTIVVGEEQRASSSRLFQERSNLNQDLVIAAEVAPTSEEVISKMERLIQENDMQRRVLEQVQSSLQQTTRAEIVPHGTQSTSEGAPVSIEESTMTRTTNSKRFWLLIAILIVTAVVVMGIIIPKVLKSDTQEEVTKEGCTSNSSCSINRADGICKADGQCLIVACQDNYDDCNQNAIDGCETNLHFDNNHCASCNNQCSLENANSDCVEGSCVVSSCIEGFGNCDGKSTNGCEKNLQNDDYHCGSCDKTCTLANAFSECIDGSCVLIGCMIGFGNCDGVSNSGCETNLRLSNDMHCGACDNRCDFLSSCTDGTCFYGK